MSPCRYYSKHSFGTSVQLQSVKRTGLPIEGFGILASAIRKGFYGAGLSPQPAFQRNSHLSLLQTDWQGLLHYQTLHNIPFYGWSFSQNRTHLGVGILRPYWLLIIQMEAQALPKETIPFIISRNTSETNPPYHKKILVSPLRGT